MRLKSSQVSVDGIHPFILPYMFLIDEWCRDHLGYELIITSCTDGQHSSTSRHYLGTAIDVRTWTEPASGMQIEGDVRSKLVTQLKHILGKDWFVLDEGTHFHIDWRPQR
jgi:hypothetical protein